MLPYLDRALRQPVQHAPLRRPGRRSIEAARAAGRRAARRRARRNRLHQLRHGERQHGHPRRPATPRPAERHIVTTRVEHPAVESLCEHLAEEGLPGHRRAGGPRGALDLDDPATTACADDTAVVSIMWANNETGVIFPDRGDRRHGQGARDRLPHRRGPGRGQDPDRPEPHRRGHAVPLRATSCTPPRASACCTSARAPSLHRS